MVGAFEILCGILAALVVLYYYIKSTHDYWKIRGVPGPKPIPLFGNVADALLGRISIGDLTKKIYDQYKNEPMVGIFSRVTPILLLRDLELIKDVLIKDFSNFSDRGFPIFAKTEPLSQHLFNLESKRWRPLRLRLSPVFTSGKMKEMVKLILECSDHLESYIDKIAEKGEPVECRELTAKFTTDVIGSCAFGIEMNALTSEDSEFRRIGRKIFQVTLTSRLRVLSRQLIPPIYALLGYIFPASEVTRFFIRSIMETIDYRKKNNIFRPDFVNTLIELKENPEKLGDVELTDSLLTSQAFVFFVAGFETSSSTMSNTLFELALNPEIQKKLREEIRETYAKCNGELKYENVQKMSYLDEVFRETLRKYPPLQFLMRQSTSSYTFSNTKVTIPAGQKIWIPLYGIHTDPAYYPEPDVFKPERFSEEAIESRHPMTYLPFGDGPRNCIGARFGVYQTKIGLIKVLRNHEVTVCDKTDKNYEHQPSTFLLTPKHGIYLKIKKVEEK